MSTAIFGFRFLHPSAGYREGDNAAAILVGNESEDVEQFVRTRASVPPFMAVGQIILNGASGHAYSDWRTFLAARSYGADSCLYKAHKVVHHVIVAEAAGTSGGGGGETFAFVRKFIDTATLVVNVDGTPQAGGGSDYTLSGNNTAPIITTETSFDTGAVTFDYEFYHQVMLDRSYAAASLLVRDVGSVEGADSFSMLLTEKRAGGSLV